MGMYVRVALCVLALTSSLARAEEDPDVATARRHFVKAKAHLANHNYEAALREFQVARSLKPLPELDYNVARCLDVLERYPEAIAEYQKYLARSPADASEVEARIQVLRTRTAHVDEKAPEKPAADKAPEKPAADKAPEKPAAEKAPEPLIEKAPPPVVEAAPESVTLRARPVRPPLYKRWWLWTAVGGGVVVGVALGVGLGVGLSASGPPAFQPSLPAFGPGAR